MYMKLKLLFILIVILFSTRSYSKEFKWAADAEGNAPYIFQNPSNPNELLGFEVDIAQAISLELNANSVHIQNQWDGLIPGLYRNDYDVALNGIEITNARKKEVLFSIPYYYTYEQIIVNQNENNINSFYDLKNKKVGVLKNSLAEEILNRQKMCRLLSYEGEVNAFEDMKNGRIDAVLVDAPIAIYNATWNPQFKFVGNPVGEIQYGIAFRKDDSLQLAAVNKALANLIKSGRLKEILAKWNLWNGFCAKSFNDLTPPISSPVSFNDYIKSKKSDNSFFSFANKYINYLPLFIKGTITTLELSIISMLIAIVIGLLLALGKVYGPVYISKPTTWFIEIIRGTPLLIQLFLIFYALPSIGIKFSPFIAAVIGLGINYSAYEAENYRAGLFSVSIGQTEASIALGMRRRQALRYIIIPQAFRLVLPPITNDFISLLKDSSLVSVITMVELTKVYSQIAAANYDFLGTGIIVAIIYLLIGLPFIKISKYTEKKFSMESNTKNIH